MNAQDAIDLGREAVMHCLLISAPILIVGLVVAIVIGVFQSMTHVHDQTVTFVPKVVLIAIALAFCLPWLTDKMIDYSRDLFDKPVILSGMGRARSGSTALSQTADVEPLRLVEFAGANHLNVETNAHNSASR